MHNLKTRMTVISNIDKPHQLIKKGDRLEVISTEGGLSVQTYTVRNLTRGGGSIPTRIKENEVTKE